MAVTDDAVREMHGVKASPTKDMEREVILREHDEVIDIGVGHWHARLTPWQARYLAAKLYRLARRIRQRAEGETQ